MAVFTGPPVAFFFWCRGEERGTRRRRLLLVKRRFLLRCHFHCARPSCGLCCCCCCCCCQGHHGRAAFLPLPRSLPRRCGPPQFWRAGGPSLERARPVRVLARVFGESDGQSGAVRRLELPAFEGEPTGVRLPRRLGACYGVGADLGKTKGDRRRKMKNNNTNETNAGNSPFFCLLCRAPPCRLWPVCALCVVGTRTKATVISWPF